jgi:predicted PurR-regulated permease PerM
MKQGQPQQTVSRAVTFAAAVITVAGLYFARDVLVPVAVALLLTFLLAPLVHRVEKMRLPRTAAVLIVVLLAFAVIGGIGYLISNQAEELALKLGSYQGDIERKIHNIRGALGHGVWAKASQTIGQMAQAVVTSQPSTEPDESATWMNRGTAAHPIDVQVISTPTGNEAVLENLGKALELVAPMTQTLIVIVFVIFMLIQREDIRNRAIRLFGHGRLSVSTQALDDAGTRISKYLIAQSAINGVYGIIVGSGLYFIGVPNAALWGLLCGLLRFIPYLGIWIAALFPIVLSFVVPEGYYAARPFLTIGLFVGVEILAANVVEPVLFGTSTGLSPLAILVAAVFWTWLWGPIGLVLSTPLTVLLVVAGKHVPQLAFLDVLLGDEPVLTPAERYYQRLLADDPEEAEDLIEEFEKSRNCDEIYSKIILPVLEMARRDLQSGALDEHRRDAMVQTIKEHVESLRKPAKKGGAAVPPDRAIRIVCLPAHDVVDEVAGLMLTNLLMEKGYHVTCVSADSLASERVEAISKLEADIAIISALAPLATAHARYMYKRIAPKFPKLPVLIGLWDCPGDLEKVRRRMGDSAGGELRLTATLGNAVEQVGQMIQPFWLARGEPARASG